MTKTLTGQINLQNVLNSQIIDINVGMIKSPSIVRPDNSGVATSAVEKVARIIKTNNLGQSLLKAFGHFRNSPENLLLVPFVFPLIGKKNDPR